MTLEFSEKYKKIISTGDFKGLLSQTPWPHFIIDDLFPEPLFRDLQTRVFSLKNKYYIKDDHPAKIQLSYINDIPLAEFFVSFEFRSLIEGLSKAKLTLNKELGIQMRQMTEESPAFPPHHDLIDKPSLVALFYLSPNWNSTNGGELLLMEKENSNLNDSNIKWVPPLENRLILFKSREEHWHSVRKVKNWTRTCVLMEWIIC